MEPFGPSCPVSAVFTSNTGNDISGWFTFQKLYWQIEVSVQVDDPSSIGIYDIKITLTNDDPNHLLNFPGHGDYVEDFITAVAYQLYKPTRYTYCNGSIHNPQTTWDHINYCEIT